MIAHNVALPLIFMRSGLAQSDPDLRACLNPAGFAALVVSCFTTDRTLYRALIPNRQAQKTRQASGSSNMAEREGLIIPALGL